VPMKPRPVRSDSELRKAAKRVDYEIRLLVHTGDHLGGFHSSPMSTPQGNAKNMALESFLLHFRNLRAFLCPSLQPISNDDVIASDYQKEVQPRDVANSSALPVDQERL
jgi:hypothetical protein